MHDYHEALGGYSARQLLHDGCGKCESRAKSPDHGIASLDRQNFVIAWQRAAEWNRNGLPDIARAEMPMLSVLWAIEIQLENYGVPIGQVPHE